MSEENLKALSRLVALTAEGYSFAGLQSKIKNQRLDAIAPQGAHSVLLEIFSSMRAAAKLNSVQLVVTATGREAEETAATLRTLNPEAEILEFPSWETLPHERLSPSPETVGRRLKVLHRLNQLVADSAKVNLNPIYVLASVRAVLQPVVAGLADHPPITLKKSAEYSFFELPLKLVEIAYKRVDMVTKRGEFAVRGGILDIFPTTAEHAVRLEFFGDELEDIREFAVADQRSLQTQISEIEIYPAREIIITPSVAGRAREMLHEFPNISSMLAKIAEGIPADGMESLAPVLVDRMVPFSDYLPTDALVTLLSPEKSAARAASLAETNEEFLHAAWDAATEGANAPIDLSAGGFVDLSQFKDALAGRQLFTVSQFGADDESLVSLNLYEIPNFKGLDMTALDWLADQIKNGQQVILVAEGHGTVERLEEQLAAAGLAGAVLQGSLKRGYTAPEAHLIVMTEGEFYGRSSAYVSPQVRKLAAKRGQTVDPLSLKAGDYVVHEIHGIGRFVELVTRKTGVGKQQAERHRDLRSAHVGDHHRYHERATAARASGEVSLLLFFHDLNAADARADHDADLLSVQARDFELGVGDRGRGSRPHRRLYQRDPDSSSP